ncbi:uncharacterized protein LOC125812746 [Solanum verrucosum]|uniref:uncharacterized protein LOC125812746 n=1 Tax=Solanum verrucosum TaxID=315347 RepID=UPI0020D09829|nr:uncharacterized protein LOC125812746 [Solanum verrucosum]
MQLGISERCRVLASIEVKATFIEEIKDKQFDDENLNELKEWMANGKAQEATLDADGVLSRYHGDGDYIIKWDTIVLDNDLQYEEELIAILDRDVHKLRTKDIKSVTIQWKNRPVEAATWEIERDMRDKYPKLFVESCTTSFFP